MRFGGRRAAFVILLMIGAGLLESISLAFLVPLLSVLTSPEDGGLVARTFALVLPAQASMSFPRRRESSSWWVSFLDPPYTSRFPLSAFPFPTSDFKKTGLAAPG